MNITSYFANRGEFNPDSLKVLNEQLKSIGNESVNREMNLFVKEMQDVHGIKGNNVITKVGSLITNYSIYRTHNNYRVFDKTVYLCDIEFPNAFSTGIIKKSIEPFLQVSTLKPNYAFAVRHVETEDGNAFDLGLTMVDLSINNDGLGILNFSNANETHSLDSKIAKEIIFENLYNPKHYSVKESKLRWNIEKESREGPLCDFVDDTTKIIYNKLGYMSLENFFNDRKDDGIIVDKRTVAIGDYMSSFFNKFLFLEFDNIEFVYNTSISSPLNITKLKTFAKFNDEINDWYIENLLSDIHSCINNLKNALNEDFYIITNITKQFIYVTITFFKDKREIRITKPLSMMYAEFALDCEMFADDVDAHAEIVKNDMIEQSCRGALESLEFARNISSAIQLVDQATQKIKMKMLENQANVERLLDKRLERGKLDWDDRERYLNSPKP